MTLGLAFLVLAAWLIPSQAFGGHEQGARILIEAGAAEVLPGSSVTVTARAVDGRGNSLGRGMDVNLYVVRTLQASPGLVVHRQPALLPLPAAPLALTARTPDLVSADLRVPSPPDVVVTLRSDLDAGTPHAVSATLDLIGTLRSPLPSSDLSPSSSGRRSAVAADRLRRTLAVARVLPTVVHQIAIVRTPAVERGRATRATAVATVVVTGTTLFGLFPLFPQIRVIFQNAGALFSGRLAARRRAPGWGVVVESTLGRPVARALVLLFDTSTKKIRAGVATGAKGNFAFAPAPGLYEFRVVAPGYVFPATHKPPGTLDRRALVYDGRPLLVDAETLERPPLLILPVDRLLAPSPFVRPWLLPAYFLLRMAQRLSLPLFVLGFGWNSLVLLWYPRTLPLAFEILYLLLFLVHLRVTLRRHRGYGRVIEAQSKQPLAMARISAYDNLTNRLAQSTVSDWSGRFFLFLLVGVYTVVTSKAGFSTLEETFSVSKGLGAESFGSDLFLIPENPLASAPES